MRTRATTSAGGGGILAPEVTILTNEVREIGKKNRLTPAQAAELSAAVARLGASLGCSVGGAEL